MTMLTIHQTAALLRSFDSVLLLTHLRPDGDTVGSAAATHSASGVPMGTSSMMGSLTSPTTDRNFRVTGVPSRAWRTLSRVPTLSTTQPTSRGRPRSGTLLPVTC